MARVEAVANHSGRPQRMAALGTSAVLAVAWWAQATGVEPAQAAPSPAAGYRVGDSLAHDEFNRTGPTLGSAPVGGPWAAASPTGLLRLEGGAATWSAFVARGQTTQAWLPEVSALDEQLLASFSFGVISRAHYGMSHRTVARRQANGDGYVTSAAVLDNGRVSLGLSRVRNRVVTLLALVPRQPRWPATGCSTCRRAWSAGPPSTSLLECGSRERPHRTGRSPTPTRPRRPSRHPGPSASTPIWGPRERGGRSHSLVSAATR
jgi:hypothetical protein